MLETAKEVSTPGGMRKIYLIARSKELGAGYWCCLELKADKEMEKITEFCTFSFLKFPK
jgi:hypothetical protein